LLRKPTLNRKQHQNWQVLLLGSLTL